ncbi:MAG TPA: TetR/AcrR family transcriptional regulator C-terminal domain-containing protein [Glaciibacter sp.]|nr:TetR/AcrR family transcriptional regulator C-terminal domain-containing protein [Glaciibacter sp.]
MEQPTAVARRGRLNRDRVLLAAVSLADEAGIESLSMRRLAQDLDVVPMALYKHVANKDELLDGMMDVLIREIQAPTRDIDWQNAVRMTALSARRALLRHPWARQLLESRTSMTPTALQYMDSVIGIFRAGGFSIDLTHHVMHALGSRIWGFTQELFDNSSRKTEAPAEQTAAAAAAHKQMAERYPNVSAVALSATHDEGSVVGQGCDDQFEFEFALDLALAGFERLQKQGWTSKQAKLEAREATGGANLTMPAER